MLSRAMIRIKDMTYRVAGRMLFDFATATVPSGHKVGLVGRNGSGKSTLLRLLAGTAQIDGGEIAIDGIAGNPNAIGTVEQEAPSGDQTPLGFTLAADKERAELLERAEIETDPLRIAETQNRLVDIGAHIAPSRAASILAGLGFDEAAQNNPLSSFSGGWRMRVALAAILFAAPDMLLLDEPTNHLDAESVAWIERFLEEYPGTVVAVTHDRYFLDNVTGWILELDRGRGIPYEGNYSSWLEQKQKRLQQEQREETSRQRTIDTELEWVRQSPRARQAKSKARITAYEDLVAQAADRAPDHAQIVIPAGDRLGELVIEAKNVNKAYGDRLLIEGLSFKLPPGGIVGVIGPNGAGKTTLFKMITGQEEPDSGTLRIGDTVKLGYIDQNREALSADKTVWEEISDGNDEILLGKHAVQSRAYVGRFNFKGADQQKKVGQLSGGERNRVHLAKMLKSGSNVILLDEPTNDLDVDTLRALELALLEFAGCAMVISHDRWFLDRIATHILAFEGDSHVEWFEGNFGDYEEDKKRRLGEDAVEPHRIKYKKIER